ncbi:hypothetical protein RUM44_010687 [Polyplax serrata]|uniref:Glutamyl-tRNA(Gln) amidotransferase subunit A, mitochondrial n=1 Tax=Polyplax serrata TaxID=468196 RepID=A0ABR1AMW4_POLSC
MLNTTIKKLHGRLKGNSVTVEEVVGSCLKRANEIKDLNAYINLNSENVEQIEDSKRHFKNGNCRSPLEGIPIAVKDNFCVKNIPTTCGSKMLKNFVPKYTATVVEKLFNSGAILLGKTNMDEFAMGSGTTTSAFGPTKNIWGSKHSNIFMQDDSDDWFLAGGSSGGSAIAVASGTCLGALGSDTGGSCRNPASYCGVVGLKPSYGLLSRHGLIPLVNSMDVPGILTLNVEDASILLGIMAGKDENDSTTLQNDLNLNLNFSSSSVKGLKIGIPIEYNCEGLSDEIKSTWDDVAKILDGGGATIVPVSMPHTKYSIVCYSILNQCEVASNMARYDGVEYGLRCDKNSSEMFTDSRSSGFNDIVRSRILGGNYFLLSRSKRYYDQALKVRRLIFEDFQNIWDKGINILLTPTTLTDAPRYSEYKEKDEREQSVVQDYCTQPANLAGCPAISIPIELSKKGFPISLQLMAPNFMEKTLLESALYIENAVYFAQYRNKFIS